MRGSGSGWCTASRRSRRWRYLLGKATGLLALAWTIAPNVAEAGCCTVDRSDPGAPAERLVLCEPAVTGACEAVLYDQDLGGGESVEVCPQGDHVRWEFPDRLAGPGKLDITDCNGTVIDL